MFFFFNNKIKGALGQTSFAGGKFKKETDARDCRQDLQHTATRCNNTCNTLQQKRPMRKIAAKTCIA